MEENIDHLEPEHILGQCREIMAQVEGMSFVILVNGYDRDDHEYKTFSFRSGNTTTLIGCLESFKQELVNMHNNS